MIEKMITMEDIHAYRARCAHVCNALGVTLVMAHPEAYLIYKTEYGESVLLHRVMEKIEELMRKAEKGVAA